MTAGSNTHSTVKGLLNTTATGRSSRDKSVRPPAEAPLSEIDQAWIDEAERREDLVLKVSPNIDPAVWDEARYEAFVDELRGNREYQKDATRTVMRFLAGQKYRNLQELAKETFDNNPEMERR
jgi:hypothetical protein